MPYLEIKFGGNIQHVALAKAAATIGRLEGSSIFVNDPDISRRHCMIEKAEGGYRIVDLASLNGTRVNGQVVHQHQLKHNDFVRIGTTEIRFVDDGLAPPSTQPASEVSKPTAGKRKRSVILACAGAILTIAIAVVADWQYGWLGGWFPRDESKAGFGIEQSDASSATSNAAMMDDPVPHDVYEVITGDSPHLNEIAASSRMVRARFFGKPTKAESGELHWELPPVGEVIAVIEAGNLVYDTLASETAFVEVEFLGTLKRGEPEIWGAGELILHVGEARIIGAWGGSNDALQQSTKQLLGQLITVDAQYTAVPTDVHPEP